MPLTLKAVFICVHEKPPKSEKVEYAPGPGFCFASFSFQSLSMKVFLFEPKTVWPAKECVEEKFWLMPSFTWYLFGEGVAAANLLIAKRLPSFGKAELVEFFITELLIPPPTRPLC